MLFVPSIVGSKKIRDLLVNDINIKKVFGYFKKLNMVIIGIGTLMSEAFLKSGYVSKNDVSTLKKSGAVGDVLNHFLDINGKICYKNLEDRLIVISPEDLKKVPYKVAIAGGKSKAEIILGAIRGNYINILITDQEAAEKILKMS